MNTRGDRSLLQPLRRRS